MPLEIKELIVKGTVESEPKTRECRCCKAN
jgi:hypothetical protein